MTANATSPVARQPLSLPPFALASLLAQLEQEECGLLFAIADAEERGDWREAAELKSRRAGMRATSRAALRR